ncbi:hypothetical protein NUW54_g6624 [Trametes sanguinea]|uniref:Uncharacterized protein n=1 Tax=Trametes sanguinea TaxID=158606 RepID=A0ACC1PRU0_9APHY|nr:hypothetical protein NUW54_g6624 [Trametes sanguinea]
MTTAAERDTPLDEDVLASTEAVVDPAHSGLEMRAEVGGGGVEDVEAVALELVSLCGVSVHGGEPGSVEDLDEGVDVVSVRNRATRPGRFYTARLKDLPQLCHKLGTASRRCCIDFRFVMVRHTISVYDWTLGLRSSVQPTAAYRNTHLCRAGDWIEGRAGKGRRLWQTRSSCWASGFKWTFGEWCTLRGYCCGIDSHLNLRGSSKTRCAKRLMLLHCLEAKKRDRVNHTTR